MLNEWNNVICSIETHSEVSNRKNGTFVRRLKSDSNEASNFIPRVQDGGGDSDGSSVSVCGCMLGGARGPLMVYTGRINNAAYI